MWRCRAGLNISKNFQSGKELIFFLVVVQTTTIQSKFSSFPELFISTWFMLVFKSLYKLAQAWVFYFIFHDFSSQTLYSCPVRSHLSQTPSSLLLLVLSCHQESSISSSLYPRLALHSLVQISPKFQGLSNSLPLRTSPACFFKLSSYHLQSYTCCLAI